MIACQCIKKDNFACLYTWYMNMYTCTCKCMLTHWPVLYMCIDTCKWLNWSVDNQLHAVLLISTMSIFEACCIRLYLLQYSAHDYTAKSSVPPFWPPLGASLTPFLLWLYLVSAWHASCFGLGVWEFCHKIDRKLHYILVIYP